MNARIKRPANQRIHRGKKKKKEEEILKIQFPSIYVIGSDY
jgi:hypothetical protein